MTIFSLRAQTQQRLHCILQASSRHLFGILFIILTPIACATEETEKSPALLTLSINSGNVITEIAATPSSRRLGLSHRPHLPQSAGMLLAFATPKKICLWMRDVSFPLTAIFIDSTAEIIDIAHMLPHTETRHCARSPAVYALEISPKFEEENNVVIGDKVLGLPAVEYFFHSSE
ncbi:MAG: DUF192 domain-containing protein [Gammaproteobacteria bacterium WSBS_2016_MAG_OTU1]